MRRWGYLVLTGALAIAGGVIGVRAGTPSPGGVATGVGLAWIVQAVAFWLLAGGLERGTEILRVWIGGMAARFGGLAVLWAGSAATGAATVDVVVSYALALLVFLLAEAAWLTAARVGRGPPTS